jgi:uncharacterized membrane protein
VYSLLKLVHVLGVVLFLGNIITGLFWKRHADASKNQAIVAHALRGLITADRIFTIPSIVVLTTAGILAAVRNHIPLLHTGWILWSIVAFSLSGIAFMWQVGPLQKRLLAMAESDGEFDWKAYRSLSLKWELWGIFATITPLLSAAMMVSKHPQ